MSKLKIVLSALIVIGSLSSLFSVVGCKKTTTNVVKDSVYYSPWLTISMKATDAGDTAYYQDITAKTVTAAVIRSGAVLSYLGSPASGDTTVAPASDYGLYQLLNVGNIEIESFGYLNDFSTSNSSLLYRYVVIPGNVLASTSLKNFSQQQLSKMTFTDIQKAASTPVQGR
ncbi:MAG TPA: hypothetical protein VKQ52_13140 [Puia sp.]|nr:hypothetical protein [Puia sp.]